jgi:hypothetical protein
MVCGQLSLDQPGGDGPAGCGWRGRSLVAGGGVDRLGALLEQVGANVLGGKLLHQADAWLRRGAPFDQQLAADRCGGLGPHQPIDSLIQM